MNRRCLLLGSPCCHTRIIFDFTTYLCPSLVRTALTSDPLFTKSALADISKQNTHGSTLLMTSACWTNIQPVSPSAPNSLPLKAKFGHGAPDLIYIGLSAFNTAGPNTSPRFLHPVNFSHIRAWAVLFSQPQIGTNPLLTAANVSSKPPLNNTATVNCLSL